MGASPLWDNQLEGVGGVDTSLNTSGSKTPRPSKSSFVETTDLVLRYLELSSFSGPRRGNTPERRSKNKTLDCIRPEEDTGGWAGCARGRRRPSRNGAHHGPFKAGGTGPGPDARAAAAAAGGYTGSSPDSSSAASASSLSKDAGLSERHLFAPGFTGSKPASNPP